MSADTRSGVSKQVGFRLDSEEKRQQLELLRVREGYSSLADFMRDMVDDRLEQSDLPE